MTVCFGELSVYFEVLGDENNRGGEGGGAGGFDVPTEKK